MNKYVVFLRGINVGGKNKIKMAELKTFLSDSGFEQVSTYIQSGNVVLQSSLSAVDVRNKIEKLLVQEFVLDSEIIKILVIDAEIYRLIIEEAPQGFGTINGDVDYRYDVLFLIEGSSENLMKEIAVREGIDKSWLGSQVIYYRRPGPQHPDYTKSALSRLTKKPIYQTVTIRNWKTTKKMYELLKLT